VSEERVYKFKPGAVIENQTFDRSLVIHDSPGVKVINCKLLDPDHGIYIRRSDDLIIENCHFEKNRIGIYIAFSENVTVRDSRFVGNGDQRISWGRREAIAIDGSSRCLIKGNVFNSVGNGVTVYSNCGEYGSEPRRPAVANWILENEFYNNHVAIWFGSRRWRDLRNWGCTLNGEWVWNWNIPKQPYPRFIFGKEWPFVTLRSWIVPDRVSGNVAENNKFYGVSWRVVDNQ